MVPVAETRTTAPQTLAQEFSETWFIRILTVLGGWIMLGTYLDGWAHLQFEILDTFFTVWHGVLYAGYGATAGFLIAVYLLNRGRGLPPGYRMAMLGVAVFGTGGLVDLGWHTLVGVENGVENFFSPAHLALALGVALIVGAPLSAAWQRSRPAGDAPGWRILLPALLSAALLLSMMTFMAQFILPVSTQPGVERVLPPSAAGSNEDLRMLIQITNSLKPERDLLGLLLQTSLSTGLLLLLVRRWQLPVGAATAILLVNAVLMALMRGRGLVIPATLAAGLAADLIIGILRPAPERAWTYRWLGAAIPFAWTGVYFSTAALGRGIWWPPAWWTGAIAWCTVGGLLLSYLAASPSGHLDSGSTKDQWSQVSGPSSPRDADG